MKVVTLATAATMLLGALPAQASVVTVGSSLAGSCYRAAETRNTSDLAMDACNRALTFDALDSHDRAGTYVNRGILWMTLGRLSQANLDFDRALAIDSNQPEAWLNKAIAQMQAGDSGAALEMADRSIAQGTRKPAVAYYIRAIANEDRGNFRAAYADFKRARSLDPNWREPAIELARYQVRSR